MGYGKGRKQEKESYGGERLSEKRRIKGLRKGRGRVDKSWDKIGQRKWGGELLMKARGNQGRGKRWEKGKRGKRGKKVKEESGGKG